MSSLIAVTESLATAIPYVRITNSVGSRELDRVIPAQPTNLRQLASAPSEHVINFDKVGLREPGVERSHGTTADVSKYATTSAAR